MLLCVTVIVDSIKILCLLQLILPKLHILQIPTVKRCHLSSATANKKQQTRKLLILDNRPNYYPVVVLYSYHMKYNNKICIHVFYWSTLYVFISHTRLKMMLSQHVIMVICKRSTCQNDLDFVHLNGNRNIFDNLNKMVVFP